MLKAVAVVAVPSVLGGVGMLYSADAALEPWHPYERAYAAEVGVALEEAAVRAALPEGYGPAPGFTGGIAIYGGEEGWTPSPLPTGHVWIDVVEEVSGDPARYMLTGFASESRDGATTIPLDVAALGETYELEGDGVLRILAWPDRVTTLDLVVKVSTADCVGRLAEGQGDLLTSGPAGRLGVIHMPAPLDWCGMEAEVLHANVTAPIGHVLRPFVPQRILWAQVATPSSGVVSAGESVVALLTE